MKYLSSDRWRFLKYSFGFVFFLTTILFITEWTLAFFVTQSDNEQTGKVNLVMQHLIDPELIVFGSSVAEVGFDSEILEKELKLSVYNMAIDGTPITGSEFLINEFLEYTQNCKVIVIGLAFFSFGENQLMNAPERYLAHKDNPHVKANFKSISPSLHNKLYYTPFYSFIVANHTYYKNAFIGAKNKLKGKPSVSDSLKGFVPHDANYQDTRKDFNHLDKIVIAEKTIDTHKAILEKIKAKGISPILVITPMYIDGQESFSNYNEYIDLAHALSTQTDVKLLDFSQHNIVYDKNNFYNNGHLNTVGARLFTVAVSDSLNLKRIKSF